MNARDYECAFFAQTTWQLSHSSNYDEMCAVACAIRNWVIPKIGQSTPYASFAEVCEEFLRIYPTRPRPSLTDPAFSGPNNLLDTISDIYDCTYPDVTANHDHPNGARYFARVVDVPEDDWFYTEVISKSAVHPLIGQWGSMHFYV